MRILVGWDNATEGDLIALYLGIAQDEVRVTTDPREFVALVEAEPHAWDVVLMALTFPTVEEAYEAFRRVHAAAQDAPILAAVRPPEVYQVARFVAAGLHTHVIRDAGGDFIFLLLQTIHAAYNAVTAERGRKLVDRLREEVESVRRLQESVIPRNIRPPRGYDVAAGYEPSQIRVWGNRPVVLAGGDYYDVITMKESELVLLVGDASGHGMKACMSIMTMHTLIRMIRENHYKNTAEFVAEVNRRLCESRIIQNEGGFITLLYCAVDTEKHTLEWTSAGHQCPLLHNLETNELELLGTDADGGLPLGVSAHHGYAVKRHNIPECSRVLLYTDGLSEAFAEADQHSEFGIEGIKRAMKAARRLSLPQALDTLFSASRAFTGGAGRHDDTSVVLLERTGAP